MTRVMRDVPAAVTIISGLVLAAALGWLAPQHPPLVLTAAAAVLLLGFSAWHSTVIPLAALPLLFIAQRIDVAGVDVSVSDVALGLAALAAVAFAQRPFSRELRNLLWLTVLYQAATLFTVVANPYAANLIEWVHSWALVAGALLVGWSVGREGLGGTALKLMLAASMVLAVWVVGAGLLQALQGDFQPVYLPYGMHKNFLGTVLGSTALIAYIRPAWSGIGPKAGSSLFWFLAIAIGFTQSRQAIVALGLTLIVLVLRTRTDRQRSRVVLLAALPALVVVLTLVRDQLASGNEHNSLFQRLTWFQDALHIWQTQPIVGVGLRWWYTDRFPGGFQPPNAELEVLSSAGIVGLLAFLTLLVGSVVVLWRMPPLYGMLAGLAVIARFIQGQLDIFWVAAQTSIPFVIAGICVGAYAHAEGHRRKVEELDRLVNAPGTSAATEVESGIATP